MSPTTRTRGAGAPLHLLPHYPALLAFVLQHRFATAQQLQHRFPDHIRTYRTAKHHVKRLTDAGYLATVPIRDAVPNSPNVYVTTPTAFPIIAAAYHQLHNREWQGSVHEQRRPARGFGWHHIKHELAVTDVDIALHQLAERRGDLRLHGTERRYHTPGKRLTFEHAGHYQAIEPDAGYFLTHERSDRRGLDLCLLEYDRGTMAPHRLRDKFHRYDTWAASSRGVSYLTRLHDEYHDTTTTRPTFRLLIVAEARPSERTADWRQIVLFTEALTVSTTMRRRMWFTTTDQLTTHGLTAPIWLRGRDAGSWIEEFNQTTDSFAPADKRAYIAKRLPTLPRHSLFPPDAHNGSESVAITQHRLHRISDRETNNLSQPRQRGQGKRNRDYHLPPKSTGITQRIPNRE